MKFTCFVVLPNFIDITATVRQGLKQIIDGINHDSLPENIQFFEGCFEDEAYDYYNKQTLKIGKLHALLVLNIDIEDDPFLTRMGEVKRFYYFGSVKAAPISLRHMVSLHCNGIDPKTDKPFNLEVEIEVGSPAKAVTPVFSASGSDAIKLGTAAVLEDLDFSPVDG